MQENLLVELAQSERRSEKRFCDGEWGGIGGAFAAENGHRCRQSWHRLGAQR